MTTPRLRAALALVALTLPLAACSGDDDPEKDESAQGDSTAVDPSRVSPTDMPKVPTLRKAKGAIADASFGECATDAGTQEVTGTVTNGTKGATDYVVTVSWINDTSDVLARGVATVKGLEPGQEREVTVEADVPDAVTSCTFHVQRGRLS